jgi:ATP-dependent RNA helicase DDX24/MAK5
VLDEADRMIEAGHFAELENILRLTLRENKFANSVNLVYIFLTSNREDQIQVDFTGEVVDEAGEEDVSDITDGLQTFVFSATLSKDLQQNVKRRSRLKSAGKKYKKHDEKPASTLG